MYKKNILFCATLFLMLQLPIYAARMKIYNESLKIQDITVYAEGQAIAGFRLGPNEERSVNTGGFTTFSGITWKSPFYEDVLQKKTNIRYKEGFYAPLESSGTMLMGSATLYSDGTLGINFDKNGSSASKVKVIQGKSVQ